MQISEKARHRVQQLKQLPALSTTVSRLLARLSDANLEIAELAAIIEQDPALTARIIGLANAAYFAQPRPITSVTEAIIRVLGLQMVKTLALSIALCGAFNARKCPGFRLDRFWYLAFGSAQLVRKLVFQIAAEHRPDPDEIYLTALLFDIGILVLVYEFPQEYAQVLAELENQEGISAEQLEQELVGITSYQAGEWLAERWHLPRFVSQAIASRAHQSREHRPPLKNQLIEVVIEWLKQPGEGILAGLMEDRLTGDAWKISWEKAHNLEVGFLQKIEEIQEVARLLSR